MQIDEQLGEIWKTTVGLDGKSKTAVKVGTFLSPGLSNGEHVARTEYPYVWVIVETGEVLSPEDVEVQRIMGRTPRP